MLTSMVRKEVRELGPLVLLALVVQFYLVSVDPMTDWFFAAGSIPFMGDVLWGLLVFVAGTTAAVVGLWQTIWESNRDTWHFLLQRPAPRPAIILTKLLVGTSVTLLIVGVPMACNAAWAATPRTHPSPFEWGMTIWPAVISAQLPVVYLGAFLSGLRPGRWLGSRSFPLAAAALVMIGLQVLFVSWAAALTLGLVFDALFVVAILEVAATRDFS